MARDARTSSIAEAGACGTPRPLAHRVPSAPARILALALIALLLALLVCPVPARADEKSEQAAQDSAADAAAGVGLTGFSRYNRGADRPVDGEDVGYRFPLAADATLVAVNTDDAVLVWVDADAADLVGLGAGETVSAAGSDGSQRSALIALICQLDENASMGGALLSDQAQAKEWVFTTEPELARGAYAYRFRVEVGGRAYTSVVPADLPAGAAPTAEADARGLDLGAGVLWADSAALVSADQVVQVAEPTAWDRLRDFLFGMDYRPFWVSLKTSAVALAVTFALGLLAAWKTMGTSSRLKGLLDSVFTIPMVLPPTVCGFLLLLLFGQATPVGQWLIAHGVALVFTWPAAVLSAIVVSFPLMYRTALGAFEGLDRSMLDAARTLGWSEGRIFRRLMLPLAWPSIAAGTVLAFARAMGEFGCTLFFAGNYAGITQTIPIAIYFQWMSGNTDVALFWVVVVILMSFLVILFINIYTARSQRYRARGITRAERRRKGAPAEPATDTASADTVRLDQEALRALLAQPAGSAAAAGGQARPGEKIRTTGRGGEA